MVCATYISSWGNVIRAGPFSKLTKLPLRHDGDVAERPNAPVLKTGEVYSSAGSNPAVSAGVMSRDMLDRSVATSLTNRHLSFFLFWDAGFVVIWGLGVGLLVSSRAFGSCGWCRCSVR